MQDASDTPHANAPAPADKPSIPRPAVAPVDALQRTIIMSGARVVALMSPHSDVATPNITTMLAESFVASGMRTLLIDATSELADTIETGAWSPGEPIRAHHIEAASQANAIDTFRLTATPATRALFNNPERIEKSLRDDLADYGVIIMHLAPILEIGETHINAVSLARAADAAFLVCTAEVTTNREVLDATNALKSADVKLAGCILDNSQSHPPGPEMAAIVEKYVPLPRGLRRRLANFLRTSEYFNETA